MAERVEAVPPRLMEWLVAALIPPAAREAVVGDLRELYVSPGRYAADALGVLPHILFSQMRRGVNWPVLWLQVSLLYACLGVWGVSSRIHLAALILFVFLLLRDIYQWGRRPNPRGAALVMVAVGASVIFLSQTAIFALLDSHRITAAWFLWARYLAFGPVVFPILCFLRLSVWKDRDWHLFATGRTLSWKEMAAEYSDYVMRSERRNVWEALLLAAALVTCSLLVRQGGLLTSASFAAMALVCIGLTFHGRARPPSNEDDFVSLRVHHQRALFRQQQLRRFLGWLWSAPFFMALYAELIAPGLNNGKPVLTVIGLGLAQILCFFLGASNNENAARTQEHIDYLVGVTERPAAV